VLKHLPFPYAYITASAHIRILSEVRRFNSEKHAREQDLVAETFRLRQALT